MKISKRYQQYGQRVTDGKQDGHGMGLQQVLDLFRWNNGTMQILSKEGVGTEIVLTFLRR